MPPYHESLGSVWPHHTIFTMDGASAYDALPTTAADAAPASATEHAPSVTSSQPDAIAAYDVLPSSADGATNGYDVLPAEVDVGGTHVSNVYALYQPTALGAYDVLPDVVGAGERDAADATAKGSPVAAGAVVRDSEAAPTDAAPSGQGPRRGVDDVVRVIGVAHAHIRARQSSAMVHWRNHRGGPGSWCEGVDWHTVCVPVSCVHHGHAKV